MVKGIYKITNNRTGEVYIGQAKDLKRRENTHFRQLAQGKHHNLGLQEDHDRGDSFSFEILEELPDATLADLYNKESHYIKKFNSFREGYNQTPGGAMDQFKGRYEYGGGRLPVEKYQLTNKYINKNMVYCSKCGTPLELEEAYCSNCGEKINKISYDSKNNIEEKTANNENSSSKKNAILIVIVLCILLLPIIITILYGSTFILFFIDILGHSIGYLVAVGIVMLLCIAFINS